VKLADAEVVAAVDFVLHDVEDGGIVESAADVGADTAGADEGAGQDP
jgi:hypothetical protein